MNIITFIKIISKNFKYILIIPFVVGTLVYFLTRHLPVQYSTTSTIFTGITSNDGLDVGENRIDNYATQNEYNNITAILSSKSLFAEVGLRLLTQHLLLDKPHKEILSDEAFEALQKNVPKEIKSLVVKGDFERTYENLRRSIKQEENNYIYRLLNYGAPYYSIPVISELKNDRVQNSDLVKLTFVSDDPGISFNTVKFATEVFIKNYSEIKNDQSSSAVEYFEQKLRELAQKLKTAEDTLLKFNTNHNIINYYEQTEQVTTQQEKIEIRLQEVKMEFDAAKAVLNQLETEIKNRFQINLRNKKILDLRQELISVNNEISQKEVISTTKNVTGNEMLKNKRHKIELKLQKGIDSIYNFKNNSQGIESQRILGEWLDALKNYESYSALYNSMVKRQTEFMKQYKTYAPLGATIKRIEREIDVYEREYLNILNSLNVAKQNQKNTSMRSKMKVMDAAEFPINSIPPKKKLFIIAAVLIAETFFILGIFIIALMDHRIKSPSILKSRTNLSIISAFCSLDADKRVNIELLNQKAVSFIYSKIRHLSISANKPFVIQIISTWDNAGKAYIADKLASELERLEYKTKLIDITKESNNLTDNDFEKKISKISVKDFDYIRSDNYNQLIDKYFPNEIYDFAISIVPPISYGTDNSVLLKTADMNLIVYNANFIWTNADNFNLNKLKECINNELYPVLTNVLPDNLEEMYGEITKKRSKLRKFLKKIIIRFN